MDNILVTGGAGFIGSHLTDALLNKGHSVFVVDDLSTGREENINPGAKFFKIRVQDKEIENIFREEKFSYVFHLAAQVDVRKSCTDPIFDADTNIIGTLNLLSMCKKYNVRKFIFSSSGGVIYGDVSRPAKEEDTVNPISAYGISKLAGELYTKFFGDTISYTILRYANVYGERQSPYGEAGVVSIFTKKMLDKEPCALYGYGKPLRDYVYVKDLVRATVLSMNGGDNCTINIGTEKSTSVDEVYSILKGITGNDTPAVYKPLREGELNCSCLSIERAKSILGWKPSTALKEGLSRVVRWLKDKGGL